MSSAPTGEVFHLALIRPSLYDDEGHRIRWLRSEIPSNTLAVVNGLGLDCAQRLSLARDIEIIQRDPDLRDYADLALTTN
jgi:hypothetical protein